MISLENSIRKNKPAMAVLDSLSKGAVFGLTVEDCGTVIVSCEKSGVLFKNPPCDEKPDFVVTMPEKVFLELSSDDVSNLSTQDYLAFLATNLFGEPKGTMHLVINANFLKLTLHGYPKLIKLGGIPLLKVLKNNGLESLSAIEKKLSTFRNK